jgi:hypothetical protein
METLLVRLIIALLALSALGCGLGVQHIAYTRQKARLSRELLQKELELRAVTQACRSLESLEALRAAEASPQIEAGWPIVSHALQAKAPGRR